MTRSESTWRIRSTTSRMVELHARAAVGIAHMEMATERRPWPIRAPLGDLLGRAGQPRMLRERRQIAVTATVRSLRHLGIPFKAAARLMLHRMIDVQSNDCLYLSCRRVGPPSQATAGIKRAEMASEAKRTGPADARGRRADAGCGGEALCRAGHVGGGVRAISAAANVNLASISYIRSKEALVEEVFRRRATKIAAERDRGLEIALRSPTPTSGSKRSPRLSGIRLRRRPRRRRGALREAAGRINTEDTRLPAGSSPKVSMPAAAVSCGDRRHAAHLDESRSLALPCDARDQVYTMRFRPLQALTTATSIIQLSRAIDRSAGRDRDFQAGPAGATLTFTFQ